MQVLRFVAEHPAATVGVREIAAALEVQPSSVSRSLAALHRERLVQRDPQTGKFSPHLDLIRLGLLATKKLDVRTVARPHLQHIVDLCNESVFLGVYDPVWKQMLRVEGIPSSRPLRYVVELDQWTEIYRGASGLAIMAYLPDAEREEVLNLSDAAASPAEPWLRRDRLEPYLAEIRDQGYACTKGRRIEGAVGLGAPVFDANGRVIADVILTVPDVRFEDRDEPLYASYVMDAAAKITAGMGGTWPVVKRAVSAR